MLWDRGYWEPEGQIPSRRWQEGRSQIHPGGREAAWQLGAGADEATTATGGKRTNWLLIKHRDEFAERRATAMSWKRIQSVASGRPMEQIAAGKGEAPKPFMLAERTRKVRPMRSGSPTAARPPRRAARTQGGVAEGASGGKTAEAEKVSAMPDFIAPQLCDLRRTAAERRRLVP